MNKIKINTIWLLMFFSTVLFYSCQQSQEKELRVSQLISDHMVLQQQQKVAFWGEYTSKQEIIIDAGWGEKKSVKSDSNGKWKMELPTPAAGGPYAIKIITRDSTIVIRDVLIGEVWLASGQSNMDMPLKGYPIKDTILNSVQAIAEANYPGFRLFSVARNPSEIPLDTVAGKWVVASPETVGSYSATAFFFARKLYKELNVPIGIIKSSWGGTVAEAWTSEKSLRTLGDFNPVLDTLKGSEIRKRAEDWLKKWPSRNLPATNEEWQDVCFADKEFVNPDFDDTQWNTIELPGRFDLIGEGSFDGAMLFRKTFIVKDVSRDYVLDLGAVNDMDATFINGQKIGGLAGSGFWKTDRKMHIPKSLLSSGTNTIAIRAIDRSGKGAFSGPMTISDNIGDTISIEGSWKHYLIAEIFMGKFYVYNFKTDFAKRPNLLAFNQNMPTFLYNGMINPLINYKIKGAIWYQGESNVGRDEQYRRLFPALINDWRDKWKTDFPFYYVQIAPYNYTSDERSSPKIRDAQRCALKTAKTGMVVTLDIGDPKNIHPANKQEVGNRLAGLALANDYGKEILASGPLYKQTQKVGDKLIVEFDFIGSGLKAGELGLFGFEIAGADKKYVNAVAKIVGNNIEVTSPVVASPEFVRYAWKNNSEASLFNREGLPASTFSSELN